MAVMATEDEYNAQRLAAERETVERELLHARNARLEMRSILKTVKRDDVREAVTFAVAAWEDRVTELEARAEAVDSFP